MAETATGAVRTAMEAPQAALQAVIKKRPAHIIDPRTSAFYRRWEIIAGVALVYVALVVPYEVAFTVDAREGCDYGSAKAVINRLVDCIFLVDMILQFFIAIKLGPKEGNVWSFSQPRIARNYLCGPWFLLDALSLSTVFFDVLPAFCEGADEPGGEGGVNPKMLRLVRLLRLSKLIRLIRGSKILVSLVASMGLSSGVQTFLEIVVEISLEIHWIACLLVLQVSIASALNDQPMLDSWLARFGYCVSAHSTPHQRHTPHPRDVRARSRARAHAQAHAPHTRARSGLATRTTRATRTTATSSACRWGRSTCAP